MKVGIRYLAIAAVLVGLVGGTVVRGGEQAPGKMMSKSEVYATLAERTGLTKPQVQSVVDELAKLSYEEAKNGFVIPGIGKLVLVDRAARVGRNPATGEQIDIPAKMVVKFRIAKSCQDAILEQQ